MLSIVKVMCITKPVDLSLNSEWHRVCWEQKGGAVYYDENRAHGVPLTGFSNTKEYAKWKWPRRLCTVQCLTYYIIIEQDSRTDVCILAQLLHLLLPITKHVCASKSLSTHSNSER